MILTAEQLASLAQEIELEDPIDWEKFHMTKDYVYNLMASHVLEKFNDIKDEERLIVAYGTIVKLLVENFIFQLKSKA